MRRSRGVKTKADYKKNHGRHGVVYILENLGLREGWLKIGCSTRSGSIRARELNEEATTGTPGVFRCIFEHKTLDCGLAEERVFLELAGVRSGKWGQEYFTIDTEFAKNVIRQVCKTVDENHRPNATSSPAQLPIAATPKSMTPGPPVQVVPTHVFAPVPPTPVLATPAAIRRFMCGICGKVININEKVECWIPMCQAKRFATELHSNAKR